MQFGAVQRGGRLDVLRRDAQLRLEIGQHVAGGGGREAQKARLRAEAAERALEQQVGHAEIVPPFGEAVHFIYHRAAERQRASHGQELLTERRVLEPFW